MQLGGPLWGLARPRCPWCSSRAGPASGLGPRSCNVGRVCSWWTTAGSWWMLAGLLWSDDFVESTFNDRYFEQLSWPLLSVLMVIFLFRSDWVLDLVAKLVLGIVGHAAGRSMAGAFRQGWCRANSVATASEHTAEAVRILSNAWENVSSWSNISAASFESSVAPLDVRIEKTATAAAGHAASALDDLPEQLQAGAVDVDGSRTALVTEPPALAVAPPFLPVKKGSWVEYALVFFLGIGLQRRFR
ncbi:unnamed protein product [Prorocentrum cordatum]|uniref:Uncharacterized protein n=1 Tax=Prorocentrum cordatum TaxID=2364126 RepID=A0ABN9SPE5_9DINO|nr:unnamed protein product [Polarella glacialis]